LNYSTNISFGQENIKVEGDSATFPKKNPQNERIEWRQRDMQQGGYPDPNYPLPGQDYYNYGQQQYPQQGQPIPQAPQGAGGYSAYPETHPMLPNVQNYQTHVEGLSGWNDPPSRNATPTEDPILKDTESPGTLIVTTLTQTLDWVKNSPVSLPLVLNVTASLLIPALGLICIDGCLASKDDAGH
jgi:hypothetical protein